jgi:hypothetical protein
MTIHLLAHVAINTIDAMEITEVLEYALERLEIVVGHGFTMLVFEQPDVYGIDDLRADGNRLISNLNEAKFAS